jgi:hypothetical protein
VSKTTPPYGKDPHSDSIPFDPGTTDLTSELTGDAIRELRTRLEEFVQNIPINALTEFEEYSSPTLQSTTSNGWKTKTGNGGSDLGYPYTTDIKSAGKYVVDFTVQVGQTDKEKQVGSRFQWRQGTSGSWITLGDPILDALSRDDAFQYRTSFFEIELSIDTNFQVRIQFGQTDDGGTGKIKEGNIKIGKGAD